MKLIMIAKLGMTVSLLALLLATPRTLLAQDSQPPAPERRNEAEPIQALLSEVRQLRIALQHLSLSAYRAQITVERLRLQQEQVNQLSKQLEGIRDSLSDSKARLQWVGERVKDMESRVSQESDPARRAQLEREYKDMKFDAERHAFWDQQQREREPQVAAKLQIEQAKLSELNDRLEALERELETDTTTKIEERRKKK